MNFYTVNLDSWDFIGNFLRIKRKRKKDEIKTFKILDKLIELYTFYFIIKSVWWVLGQCRPISGASMNPARSLGPAIVSWAFDDIWIYITAPVIGAVTGAFLSSVLRLRPPPLHSSSSPSNSRLFHRSSSANAHLIT